MDLGEIDGRFCDEEKKYYAIVYTTRSPNKRKCNNDDAFGDDTFTNSTGVNYGGTGYAYTMISVCAPRKNDDLIIGTSSNKLRILDYLTQDGPSKACLPNTYNGDCGELRCCHFDDDGNACNEGKKGVFDEGVDGTTQYAVRAHVYDNDGGEESYYYEKEKPIKGFL